MSLDEFCEKVLHCQKKDCPFYQTKEGRYPKFSYGNSESKIMAVFQNPGSPHKKIHDKPNREEEKNIFNITINEMREFANDGITNWLFKLRKLDENLFKIKSKGFLDSFYLTQSYRCPDTQDKIKLKLRNKARLGCREYLAEEIELIKPVVIFAFGEQSLQSVAEIFKKENEIKNQGIKKMFLERKIFDWNGVKIFPIVHPDGFWKKPEIEKPLYEQNIRYFIELAATFL